jgi:uncharacterized protein
MANTHGEFIWYELMTRDPDAAKAFYDDVIGWNIGQPMPGDVEYRQIMAGDEAVGGVLRLTDEMCEHGAQAVWLGYVGVDDVDQTVARLQQLGGSVLMPAQDITDVGRFAMVADPEGVPFYVMRGAVEGGTSHAFKPMAHGHCSWNELATRDQTRALAFYGELFGWTSNEGMPMGDMGTYKFVDHRGVRIGAVSPHIEEGGSPTWTYYFYVPDIDTAMSKTKARGGQILHGPHEVPGGDHIIIGADPEGVMFALVGSRRM